jgi:K+-transporting ATPase A subunit
MNNLAQQRTTTLSWKKIGLFVLAIVILVLVFALYFVPEVVIGLAEQAWALCGW